MRHKITAYLDHAITGLLLVVAGVTPILFFNQTTEFYEMPKLLFLIVSVALLLGMWIFSWILKGKVIITRTPLDIPLLVLMVVVIASAYFSESRYAAIYGNFPRVHGSAVAWVTYILLYFVTVSHLRNLGQIKTFLYVLYGSGFVVALISVLSYFRLFLPVDFAQAVNFTPTGSSFSTVAFLLLLLPFPVLSLINPTKYMPTGPAVVLSTLFSVTIVLLGSIPALIAMLVIYALTVFVSKPAQIKKTVAMFMVPVVVTALILAASYIPLPGGLNQMQANFPKEIQLPFATSWKVSASAFRDAPFIGTGPSTYLFNFTAYKPLEFNQLDFWNFSFDTAYNEFLQVLGTLGILGLVSVLLLCLIVLNSARKNMSLDNAEANIENSHEGVDDNAHVMLPALAISGVVAIILLAIHATTLVSTVATLFIFAAFMVAQKSVRSRVMKLSMGIKASTSDNKQFDLFPVLIFIAFLIAAVPVLYKTFNTAMADYYHRQALSQANQNGTKTYEFLQKAETLNPEIDLYRVDMAQTNFALANAIAAAKGPQQGQASTSGTLTDQDRSTIQSLLSQSVNEGRAAVALSPRSSRNWEVLASIYRNITGVADNALVFSLDAYGRAIQRDPLNPALRVNVGGIYYSIKNYDLAIRFFSDAANLKPDYANAYYNLAIALRDKGDLQNAKAVAEQAVKVLSENRETQDYKTATALLNELNVKLADSAAETPNQASASAQTQQTALEQNVDGVEVDELQNAPSVTPAPTVRPNPAANLPQGVQQQQQRR
jgi:tetratricopeptide (TPR) repeat protein